MMVRLLSTVAIAVVFGVAAGLLPRVAYRLAVPATEPSRRSCAGCGRRFRPGWRGWLRFGRACRTCPADPPGPRWAVSGLVALAVGALTWQAHPGTLERDLLLLTWLIVVEAGALLAMIDLAVHRLPTPLVTAMAAGVSACIAMAALVSRDPQLAIACVLAAAVMGGGYLLLAMFTPSQVGMGDVRLAAVLGTALGTGGWDAVLPYLLVVPLAIVQIRRRHSTGDGQVPFGPFLVAGTVLAATVAAF